MLDEKTRELIAVGASITAHCQPCLEYHVAKARELGAAAGDILAAVEAGRQVRRGAAAKMDRFAAHHLAGEAAPESRGGGDCADPALEAPILLMQGNPRQVVGANRRALELFGKERAQVEAHRGGEVFDCVHSFSAAGCGQDANCEHCVIKGAIVDTFATAVPHRAVAATLPVKKAGALEYRALQVSTEKVGDHVLVRIEKYDEVAGGEAHAST